MTTGASKLLTQFCFLKCVSLPDSIGVPGSWPGCESYSQPWAPAIHSTSHLGGQQPDPHTLLRPLSLAHGPARQLVLGPDTQDPSAFTILVLSLSGLIISLPWLLRTSLTPPGRSKPLGHHLWRTESFLFLWLLTPGSLKLLMLSACISLSPMPHLSYVSAHESLSCGFIHSSCT